MRFILRAEPPRGRRRNYERAINVKRLESEAEQLPTVAIGGWISEELRSKANQLNKLHHGLRLLMPAGFIAIVVGIVGVAWAHDTQSRAVAETAIGLAGALSYYLRTTIMRAIRELSADVNRTLEWASEWNKQEGIIRTMGAHQARLKAPDNLLAEGKLEEPKSRSEEAK
jgi:hypothetical protein